MSGGCLKNVWIVFGCHLECVCRVSGGCLGGVCWLSSGNKEGVWRVKRRCLKSLDTKYILECQFLGPKLIWTQIFGILNFLEATIFGLTVFDIALLLSTIQRPGNG